MHLIRMDTLLFCLFSVNTLLNRGSVEGMLLQAPAVMDRLLLVSSVLRVQREQQRPIIFALLIASLHLS